VSGEKGKLCACCARIELQIPGALTLKDRRAVIRSIIERLKSRFNVSVADLDAGARGADLAAIGIAAVSNKQEHAAKIIRQALDFIEDDGRVECGGTSITEM
jgi:uncharacterized protein